MASYPWLAKLTQLELLNLRCHVDQHLEQFGIATSAANCADSFAQGIFTTPRLLLLAYIDLHSPQFFRHRPFDCEFWDSLWLRAVDPKQ